MNSSPFQDHLLAAESDQEAEQRFRIAKSLDPFPEIPPSLLNSADIHDYVRMTGMLYPYDSDDLKSASYEAPIFLRCIVWDQKGERRDLYLEEGKDEEVTLKANSIALVQVKPHIRLPDYIALRFNLKITHVHRGILLGTWPLVDPGFEGKLLIPLHNLTTNDYTFKRDEGLIWVELTKTTLSSEMRGDQPSLPRRGTYRPFRDDKKNQNPDYYIDKATKHRPIRSSIPDVLRQGLEASQNAAAQAEAAKDGAKKAERYVGLLSIGGGVVLLISLLALGYQTWNLIGEAWKTVSDVQQILQSSKQDDRNRRLDELQKQLEVIDKRTTEKLSVLEDKLDKVKVEIKQVDSKQAQTKQQIEQGAKVKK